MNEQNWGDIEEVSVMLRYLTNNILLLKWKEGDDVQHKGGLVWQSGKQSHPDD